MRCVLKESAWRKREGKGGRAKSTEIGTRSPVLQFPSVFRLFFIQHAYSTPALHPLLHETLSQAISFHLHHNPTMNILSSCLTIRKWRCSLLKELAHGPTGAGIPAQDYLSPTSSQCSRSREVQRVAQGHWVCIFICKLGVLL